MGKKSEKSAIYLLNKMQIINNILGRRKYK